MTVVEIGSGVVLAVGSIAGSEQALVREEPRTSGEVLALLDNGTPSDVVRAIGSIDRFPNESQALLKHAEEAVLKGRCKHYGCISELFALKSVDRLDSIERVLTEGSGEILYGGYRGLAAEKFKTLEPQQQDRLVKLAISSLSDAYEPIRWEAAWFIMFADNGLSKEPFAAYRKGLFESLARDDGARQGEPALDHANDPNYQSGSEAQSCGCTSVASPMEGFWKRKAQIARTIGYLKGCGKDAWLNLIALGERELSSEQRIEQDVVTALVSLAPYQTGDPKPFLEFIRQANDAMQQLVGVRKEHIASMFGILVSALARYNHPNANALLLELLENDQSGDAVAEGLRYTAVSMTADQALTLMRKHSSGVRFVAARSAVDLPEHSKELAEPAIRALLRSRDSDASSTLLEKLLYTFELSALPAVKKILSGGKPREQLTIMQALVRVGKKAVFHEAVVPLANDAHESIRSLAKRYLDSANNGTLQNNYNPPRSRTEVEPVPAICL